jgi:hypothetical protein
MSRIFSVLTALLLVWLSFAAAQTQKKAATPAKKTSTPGKTTGTTKSSTPAKTATTAKKSTATTHTAASRSGKKTVAKRPAVTWRNRQAIPSPERYREIQNALVQRGYLTSEQANGTWNQASIDAMKKFQSDQNLENSGKINSLSLIALGLGPKRDASPVVPPKPQTDHGPGQ